MFSDIFSIFVVPPKEKTLTVTCLLTRFFTTIYHVDRFPPYFSTILERLATGAISVWGRVGEVVPPRLVMLLTVEPSKPRLCNDDRVVNLWTIDKPFKLDLLPELPRYVHKDSYQSVTDDKSGYDHILLSLLIVGPFLASNGEGGGVVFCQQHDSLWLEAFGFHLSYNWFPCFSSLGYHAPCISTTAISGSLLFVPLPSPIRPQSLYLSLISSLLNLRFLLFVTSFLPWATVLDYPSLSWCHDSRFLIFGFISDSSLQAFTLIPTKKGKFIAFLRDILSRETVQLVTLQKQAGKCVSMALAVPDSLFFY